MGHGTTFFNDPDPANDEHKFKEPTMNDSRNAEQIRDILRGQFDAWAGVVTDPARAAIFSQLAETAINIPAAVADAYSEFF